MLDSMRDGMVWYYRFGETGQRVLDEMKKLNECETLNEMKWRNERNEKSK